MSPQLINDSAHCKRRAEEARRVAQQLDDPGQVHHDMEIAQSYERLAEMAAQRQLAPKDEP